MRRPRTPPKINTLSFGFTGGRDRQKPMAAADQHNEIELNYVHRGEMLIHRGTETVPLPQGTAAIYWAAVPHQVISVKPGTEISWFVLPLASFLAWKLPAEFNKRMLGGEMLLLKKTQSRVRMPSFGDWAGDFDKSPQLQIAVKLEIEAFFRRLAASSASPPPRSKKTLEISGEHQSRYIERMVGTITARFREPLTIGEIARSVKLNPEYAMRLFRSRWGMTLWAFLLQQRIVEARRLLLLSDTPVVGIAFACGFQSVSRFYHAFKTQCQCSPAAYRRKHAEGG